MAQHESPRGTPTRSSRTNRPDRDWRDAERGLYREVEYRDGDRVVTTRTGASSTAVRSLTRTLSIIVGSLVLLCGGAAYGVVHFGSRQHPAPAVTLTPTPQPTAAPTAGSDAGYPGPLPTLASRSARSSVQPSPQVRLAANATLVPGQWIDVAADIRLDQAAACITSDGVVSLSSRVVGGTSGPRCQPRVDGGWANGQRLTITVVVAPVATVAALLDVRTIGKLLDSLLTSAPITVYLRRDPAPSDPSFMVLTPTPASAG